MIEEEEEEEKKKSDAVARRNKSPETLLTSEFPVLMLREKIQIKNKEGLVMP